MSEPWLQAELQAEPPAKRPVYVCLDASDGDIERRILGHSCEVRMLNATCAAELRSEDLDAADVVAVWHTIEVDDALLGRLPRCKLIVRMGVGYDNVDVRSAGARGIPVCNVPDYGTEEVADSALALILGLFRGSLEGCAAGARDDEIRGADAIARAVPYVRRVRGATLGLVGLGRIGAAVAVRAKAFGLDVSFFDPHVADGYDKALGIRRAPTLEALLERSDCVSVHCNCAARGARQTLAAPEKYLDAAAFDRLPRGALFVNTARGELVDEAALADALASGRVAAAALDVHAAEPFRERTSPLGAVKNCFHCPHSAWYSPESRIEMREKGATAARAVVDRVAEIRAAAVFSGPACFGDFHPPPTRNVVNADHLSSVENRERLFFGM